VHIFTSYWIRLERVCKVLHFSHVQRISNDLNKFFLVMLYRETWSNIHFGLVYSVDMLRRSSTKFGSCFSELYIVFYEFFEVKTHYLN
jgi:hypothetical protein